MIRFGKIDYPNGVLNIIQDKEMVSVLFKFVRREVSDENLLFLMSPFRPQTLYLNFLKPGSPHEVNIAGPTRARAMEIGEQALWADPAWASIIEDVRGEVERLFDNDTLSRFWKSPEFLDYHEKKGGNRQDKVVTLAMQAAEALGFKDHRLLDAYMAAYKAKGEDAVLTAATKLLRSEGKAMRVTDFNEFLIDRGYMKKSSALPKPAAVDDVPPPPPRIKLDLKKLKDCGFDNVGGVTIQERCQEMIEHYLNKDTQKAILVYEKILRAEPKKSKVQTVTLVDMMVLLKTKRAYEDLAP